MQRGRSEVGNIGITAAFKRFLGIKGALQLQPSPDLLPVIVAGDVQEAPYSTGRRRFTYQSAVAALAGQPGAVGLFNLSVDVLVIERIVLSGSGGSRYRVILDPGTFAAWGTPEGVQYLDSSVGAGWNAAGEPVGFFTTGAAPAAPIAGPIFYGYVPGNILQTIELRVVLRPNGVLWIAPDANAMTVDYNVIGYREQL